MDRLSALPLARPQPTQPGTSPLGALWQGVMTARVTVLRNWFRKAPILTVTLLVAAVMTELLVRLIVMGVEIVLFDAGVNDLGGFLAGGVPMQLLAVFVPVLGFRTLPLSRGDLRRADLLLQTTHPLMLAGIPSLAAMGAVQLFAAVISGDPVRPLVVVPGLAGGMLAIIVWTRVLSLWRALRGNQAIKRMAHVLLALFALQAAARYFTAHQPPHIELQRVAVVSTLVRLTPLGAAPSLILGCPPRFKDLPPLLPEGPVGAALDAGILLAWIAIGLRLHRSLVDRAIDGEEPRVHLKRPAARDVAGSRLPGKFLAIWLAETRVLWRVGAVLTCALLMLIGMMISIGSVPALMLSDPTIVLMIGAIAASIGISWRLCVLMIGIDGADTDAFLLPVGARTLLAAKGAARLFVGLPIAAFALGVMAPIVDPDHPWAGLSFGLALWIAGSLWTLAVTNLSCLFRVRWYFAIPLACVSSTIGAAPAISFAFAGWLVFDRMGAVLFCAIPGCAAWLATASVAAWILPTRIPSLSMGRASKD